MAIRTVALLRVDHAREPGVADPGPPQHAEHEQALGDALPGRVVGHQLRALREGEHEDEVEEQLERRDRLLLAQHGGEARGCGEMRRWPRADRGRSRARASRARRSVSRRTTALAAGRSRSVQAIFRYFADHLPFVYCFPDGDTRSRRDVRMDGMDSRSARTRTRGAGWLCALVVTACTLLVPGVAHAGIGVSAVPLVPDLRDRRRHRPDRDDPGRRTATTASTRATANYGLQLQLRRARAPVPASR